jgi:D-alanyl-D-alanine carboxypeptidase (penicillin-binding protein 5/6)
MTPPALTGHLLRVIVGTMAGSILVTAVALLAPAAAIAAPAATWPPATMVSAAPAADASRPAAASGAADQRLGRPRGQAGPGPRGVSARGAELAAAASGQRLWGRAENVRRPMASITKVMTALVVIAARRPDRQIRISAAVPAYVRRNDAGSAGLRVGDVLTARQLLEAMLLPSGCDAAYALATAYGPGWRAFVAKMNATAGKMGLRSTHFANFDGLPWPTGWSTYSTPRDLVVLGRAAMRHAIFRRIVRQRSYYLAGSRQHHAYLWRTTNLLLSSYRGAIGIKTGWTDQAGYCLLFEASRGGRTLIGVVLDASTTNPDARFTAAARVLDWGFGTASGRLRLRPLAPGSYQD